MPPWTTPSIRKAKEWYYSVFKACPRLKHVTIAYSDEKDMSNVFTSLALPSPFTTLQSSISPAHPSSIRSLAFLRDFTSKPGVDFTSVFEALRKSSILALDEVSYNLVEWPIAPGGILSTTPQFPLPLEKLYLHEDVPSFAFLFRFFPQQLSTLQNFTYEGRTIVTAADFNNLARLVGANLKKLFMSFVAAEEKLPFLALGPAHDAPHLSPEAFNSYSALTALSLCGTHGPSLALLETLVQSSPLLNQIRFIDSHWRCNHKPDSTDPDEVFPEAQILKVLLRFAHLKAIWLGYLPTYDKMTYWSHLLRLNEAGIGAAYEVMKREGEEEESEEESEEAESDSEECSRGEEDP